MEQGVTRFDKACNKIAMEINTNKNVKESILYKTQFIAYYHV